MANMRILIRIVFVIFIANKIDYLGGVCDNCCDCCDCFKEENENEEIKKYEEIKEDKNNTAKSLVNIGWYDSKDNPVLKIFKTKDDNVSPSTGNEDKISIKLKGKNNPKIAYLQKKGEKDHLKLEDKKYAFFEIKTYTNNTVYLYCSDIESEKDNGIFEKTNHVSISVIACDTTNVKNMKYMFYKCSSLIELDLQNFNTKNVTNMGSMFSECSNLTELYISNFNTTNVTDMGYMFSDCSNLKELDLKNFNTTNVKDMAWMFSKCNNLTKLDLNNFNTTKVTHMRKMFCECNSLEKLEFGENFNTTNVTDMYNMFSGCSSFPEEIQSNLNDVKGIIDYFKKNK